MKTICFSMLAVLGLLTVATYGDEPKGYRVMLSDAKIGAAELKAGEYKMLVHRDEPKVSLVEARTGHAIDAVARVESVDKKFDRTEVYSQEMNGVRQISEIRIGGTKLRIDFRQGPPL